MTYAHRKRGRPPGQSVDSRVPYIADAIANQGESYQSIANHFGVSRERIRQIAKQYKLGGGRAAVREKHNRIFNVYNETRDFEKCQTITGLHSETLRGILKNYGINNPKMQELYSRQEMILGPLAELVRQGKSIRQAAGLNRNLAARLQDYCKKHGINPPWSRWTDLSHRIPLIKDCRSRGLTWKQISIEVAKAEGNRPRDMVAWSSNNIPDLPPKLGSTRQPKPHRERRPYVRKTPLKPRRELSPVSAPDDASRLVKLVCSLKGTKSAATIARELELKSRNVVIGIWYRAALKSEKVSDNA